MFVCCECCVLSGRGLCDGLITRPEESYRLWRVDVCDQETSYARRLQPRQRVAKYNPQWVVAPVEEQEVAPALTLNPLHFDAQSDCVTQNSNSKQLLVPRTSLTDVFYLPTKIPVDTRIESYICVYINESRAQSLNSQCGGLGSIPGQTCDTSTETGFFPYSQVFSHPYYSNNAPHAFLSKCYSYRRDEWMKPGSLLSSNFFSEVGVLWVQER